MTSIVEWRRLILKQLYSSSNRFDVIGREKIFERFGSHYDFNAAIALDSLIRDKFILTVGFDSLLIINFDKKCEILLELYPVPLKTESIDLESSIINFNRDVAVPLEEEFKGLRQRFVTDSSRKVPNYGRYHHCTKIEDDNYWITLVKTGIRTRATRLNMGSLIDPASRLGKIFKACKDSSKRTGTFLKKKIEDIEPQACGNNRQYSKAALEILCWLKLVEEIGTNGKSITYRPTGIAPKIVTLTEIFESIEQKSIADSSLKIIPY